jgi:myo-inositol-1(or 4)-monophosphatase
VSGLDDAVERLALDVVAEMRAAAAAAVGTPGARASVGVAPGGDVTMAIDEVAERALSDTCAAAGDIAFYSEDRGYVEFGRPRAVFVVDPVDGTRPAAAGLEAACVSLAVLPPSRDATLGDVQLGIVSEVRSGLRYVARRGQGVHADAPVRTSTNTDLAALFWTAGLRGRPALPMTVVFEHLIDDCAMRGAFFELGSATFAMTRVVTGQLDAYIDVGQHVLDMYPQVESRFRAVGNGALCTNFPYDVAAAALIVREAGGVVTAPDDRALDDRPAIGSGDGFGVAVVASASRALHERLLAEVQLGMDRLGRWLQREPNSSGAPID